MYTTNFIYKAPEAVLQSLNKLFLILKEEANHFQQAVYNTDNRQLKDTVTQFLQETNQYVNEIRCQIESLGGNAVVDDTIERVNKTELTSFNNSKDIYDYCEECEGRILTAYREILNQSVIIKDLRSMIRYQLNGLLCAFLQFKLLKKSFNRRY